MREIMRQIHELFWIHGACFNMEELESSCFLMWRNEKELEKDVIKMLDPYSRTALCETPPLQNRDLRFQPKYFR